MKQDLNLMPRKESTVQVGKILLPVLLVVLVFAAILYAGIALPENAYQRKRAEMNNLQEKLNSTQAIFDEYNMVMADLSTLQLQQSTMAAASDTGKGALDILQMIERLCPDDIRLRSVQMNRNAITIRGMAAKDTSIAQFVVLLRQQGIFGHTNITTVNPGDVSFSQAYTAQFNEESIRADKDFAIYLEYVGTSMDEEDEE